MVEDHPYEYKDFEGVIPEEIMEPELLKYG